MVVGRQKKLAQNDHTTSLFSVVLKMTKNLRSVIS